MKHRLTRKEILVYRIIFFTCVCSAIFLIVKGVVVFASDHMTGLFHKAGVSIIQSLYLKASATGNDLFCYVVRQETSEKSFLYEVAEEMSINYYALHYGTAVPAKKEQIKQVEPEDNLLFANLDELAENIDEENRNITESELETRNLMEEENQEVVSDSSEEKLVVTYALGEISLLPEYEDSSYISGEGDASDEANISVGNFIKSQYSMEKLSDVTYLLSNFYIVDSSTKAIAKLFDVKELLVKNLSIKKRDDVPQILIYHTHATEAFVDSKNVQADTVVGVGTYLTELLEKKGYVVYHDKTAYDKLENGESNRNFAYSTARPCIEKILAENPSIEVVIDLHRDSGNKRVTTINGKDTAKVMFFNGLCRNKSGPYEHLPNPNLKANLAFSLQSALVGRKLFPGFVNKNYLKNYRYNQHLRERYLLLEIGTVNNTVLEAYNAMEPLSVILDQVLSNP